jgi:hypothetical protein
MHMPIQTIAPMIFGTSIGLLSSILIATGCFFVLLKVQTWYSLLMITGAVFALLVRIISATIGFLQMTDIISLGAYQSSTEVTYALGTIGHLCFAAGFAITAFYIGRRLAPPSLRDSGLA